MIIKPVAMRDLNTITDLHIKNLPYTASKIGKEYVKSLYRVIILNPQEHLCLAAIDEGKVVGLISATKDLKKTQWIIKKGLTPKIYLLALKALLMFKVSPFELFRKIRFENLLVKKFKNPYPTILTLFVIEQYRRQGVGKKLIKSLKENFKVHSSKIYVDTLVKNERAKKFYQSTGFKKVVNIKDSVVWVAPLG